MHEMVWQSFFTKIHIFFVLLSSMNRMNNYTKNMNCFLFINQQFTDEKI